MKLRDAIQTGLARQQKGQEIYEVAELFNIPGNSRIWSITKSTITEEINPAIYHGDQFDNIQDFVDNHLALDPNEWYVP